ncbi:hypothetical protein ACROYT_G044220 [Oculina patagonica]
MAENSDLHSNISYKQLQERFVSDLNGTSLLEISAVVSSAPTAVLLRTILFNVLFSKEEKLSKSFFCCMVFLFDYCTLVIPVLLAFTVLADHITTLITTCLSLSVGMVLLQSLKNNKLQSQHFQTLLSADMSKKRPFIGGFRAYVVIATAIAILAVDFVIYPRRLAKAETYGSGLMDVGVGAFIISNAIVSPEARGVYTSQPGFISAVFRSVKSSLPLLVLGVMRFISVKGTDYQEHVSEYGIHWNFFFTLLVVRVLSTVLIRLIPGHSWYGMSGVATALMYQYLLSSAGLREFVLYGRHGNGSREGFVDANREGLCSCVGYLALYLIGVQLGRFLFQKRNTLGQWIKALSILISIDIVFYLLVYASQQFISPISRRMANLSFVLWQVAYNIQLLSSFLLCDVLITAANHLGLLADAETGGCPVCYPGKVPDEQSKGSRTGQKMTCACFLASVNRNQLECP